MTDDGVTGGQRRAELVTALAEVRHRIHDAATAAERDPREITLIAVTKTFPAADAAILAELGVLDLAESRDQEARKKIGEVPDSVRWHFVGQLQTNKCRSVASYANAVHTVDRAEVADALSAGVTRAERAPLPVLIQVSLDGDPKRGGVSADALPRLADHIGSSAPLRLHGVMAVAPMNMDPAAAFGRLAEVSAALCVDHPQAGWISAGMSGDLVEAIAAGATHVRVGTALLGRRSANID